MSAPNLQTLWSLSTRCLIAYWLMTAAAATQAWWGDGHALLSRASIEALPDQMPQFFRDGGDVVAHMSLDPDLAKNSGVPLLSHGEFSEHNFDPELLKGETYPDKRYDFVKLCSRLGVAPEKVGFSPYAIAEWTQRLAVAFAEHRRWPNDQTIQQKSLIYAGFLAHYSQDLVQPLHATIHYDGRADANGKVPNSGIHETVDAALERMGVGPIQLAAGASVTSFEGNLFEAIRRQVQESNGQVTHLYDLADQFEGADGPSTEQARRFIHERGRRAAEFTASLYLTAWVTSKQLRLPGWVAR